MKSAVEWIVEQLEVEIILTDKDVENVINQAKEIEKQQRHYAYQYGREDVFDWLKKMDYDFLVDEIIKTK